MKPAVLFAGPSIHGLPEDLLAGLDIRAPARCGDLARAVEEGAATIGLVDGMFESSASTWHKEILWALSQGVSVLGGASMGALRASEMAPFGMLGVGMIYRLYSTGRIHDDDEVAVIHGPKELGYPPLSEAMINIRYSSRDARRSGVISTATEKALTARAKALYYKARTMPAILGDDAGLDEAEIAALRSWLPVNGRNVKREDAAALILRLRAPPRPSADPPAFVATHLWTAFAARYLARRSS